ncbi:hypothetical protein Drorol1_Dr00010597 [Drosera rotundifolia]
MADIVQFRLERMLPELESLSNRGLFSKSELASIIKQRRKFEYRIRRPSPIMQDFMDYIEYEKRVDELRVLRIKREGGEGKGWRGKRVGDYGGVRRIMEVYGMAAARFKGDLGVWMEYLEFCRVKRSRRMNKVLVQAIRFHPKVPELWIYAAAWEFDHNLNAEAARVIMQSALRACPGSEDLWVEYLRMELTYLNKLKTRKVILGEDVGSLIREDKDSDEMQWRDENKDLFMSLDDQNKGENVMDEENGEPQEKVDMFREQGFSILRTVYKGAVEAIPDSFSLRKRFFEILEAIDLAHSEEMRDEIIADMKRDFSKDPEYWDWLARHEINNPGTSLDLSAESVRCQVDKARQVYEAALKALPTAAVLDHYIRFFMQLVVDEGDPSIMNTSVHGLMYVAHLMGVFDRAETMGCLTVDLAHQHISLYLRTGNFDEAKRLAKKYCGKFSSEVQLWDLRVSIEMKCITSSPPSKADLSSMYALLKEALTKAAVSHAQTLWLTALEFFANEEKYFRKLVKLSVVSLTRDGGSEDGFSLSSVIVDSVLQKDGIEKARALYKRYTSLPHPGLALYRHCIELEKNLTSSGEKEGLVNARKLFEAALSTYKDDASLWRDYFSMETEMGNSETANGVYWRAKKILKDDGVFISPRRE